MAETGGSVKQGPVTELKVTAHLMTLEPGLFCVFQAPTGVAPDRSGLPGVRLSLRPGAEHEDGVEIGGFRRDGWISEFNDAALVRVTRTAQILVSIYQASDQSRAPNLQVMRIAEPPGQTAPATAASMPVQNGALSQTMSPDKAEMSAHIERRGDVLGLLGDWMGEPGSKRWIEGFALDPKDRMAADDIEYQAVLGRGWLSPWVPGGEFCGSRGMALPILGLRVRLRGEAAGKYDLAVSASFVDGSKVGPVHGDQAAEAESLAPLEAFRVQITDHATGRAMTAKAAVTGVPSRAVSSKAVSAGAKAGRRVTSSLPSKTTALKPGVRRPKPSSMVSKPKPKR